MSLKFSAMHLVIDDKSPSAETLKPVFAEAEDQFSIKEAHYLIAKENLDDQYFWLYARHGKSLPRSTTVYNTKNKTEEDNPRSDYQVEPNQQLFALYSIPSQTLYLSNTQKKSWVEEYLKAKLKQDVVIKRFFKDVDEFVKQMKSVEKMRFVSKRNLLTAQGGLMDIFPRTNDLYGLGIPKDCIIETNFDSPRPTKAFIERLRSMVDSKKTGEVESLVCIGRDDKNLETVFNLERLVQKVPVEADKDNQGFYDPMVVKQALIGKIRGFDEKRA